MSYPTPNQPTDGNQYPSGAPDQPTGAPQQYGDPTAPYGAPAPQYGAPGDPAYAYQPPVKTGLAKVPLPAWIAGGVVVVLAVVLIVVFAGGGGGSSSNGCANFGAKATALDKQLSGSDTDADPSQISSELDQLVGILNDSANKSSGKTASDMRALAADLTSLKAGLTTGDFDPTALSKLDTDLTSVGTDCGVDLTS